MLEKGQRFCKLALQAVAWRPYSETDHNQWHGAAGGPGHRPL